MVERNERGLLRRLVDIIEAIDKEFQSLDSSLQKKLRLKGFGKKQISGLVKIADVIKAMNIGQESVWFGTEETKDVNQMSLFP